MLDGFAYFCNMNILFPERTSEHLLTATDEIGTLLEENCLKYRDIRHTIFIATWLQMKDRFSYWRNVIERGFAFSTHYLHNSDYLRLIIINEENCNAANLDNEVLKAIMLHELGHLLNHPPLEVEPNNLYCIQNKIPYCREEHQRIAQLNNLKKEIYTDAYAKQHGYTDTTLGGFAKYNVLFQTNVGTYAERVEAINSNEQYIGTVRPIERQGF
ncbi:MAG: hypothetical protein RLZZ71_1074 [Bacteroidota bacterium]|jgi:hypothetical protein